jgi:hypothetical protein
VVTCISYDFVYEGFDLICYFRLHSSCNLDLILGTRVANPNANHFPVVKIAIRHAPLVNRVVYADIAAYRSSFSFEIKKIFRSDFKSADLAKIKIKVLKPKPLFRHLEHLKPLIDCFYSLLA